MTKNLFYATMAILAVLVLLAASLWYAFSGDMRAEVKGMPAMAGQEVDRNFIEQMIPHHEGAIAMAEIALERTKRAEMRSLATGIIEAQAREIADMRAWYQAWYGSAPASAGHGMHMDSMEGDMAALSAVSEAQFDREFIEQMIPHHEMAVVMARMLAAGTERAEMEVLADQIIASQSREIEMMRSWLLSWY